jgi:hypothetical protein
MNNQSHSSHFRALLESALNNYQNQTGTILVSHPLTVRFRDCETVESVVAIFEEQIRVLGGFQGKDDRIVKPLKHVVSVLFTLSASTTLVSAMGQVRRTKMKRVP